MALCLVCFGAFSSQTLTRPVGEGMLKLTLYTEAEIMVFDRFKVVSRYNIIVQRTKQENETTVMTLFKPAWQSKNDSAKCIGACCKKGSPPFC